jgi:hypothetical protein
MTRSRADANAVINASAPKYYGSRTSAGLLITEGINVTLMSMPSIERRACGRTTKSRDGRPSWITHISKAATSSLNSGTQDAPAHEVFSEISSRFPPPG